jgi:hypothetical protein
MAEPSWPGGTSLPASISSTLRRGSSDSRAASTHPALPPPTIAMSHCVASTASIDQPLTAPLVRPETMCRPSSAKAIRIGTIASIDEAVSGPHSRPKKPMKL